MREELHAAHFIHKPGDLSRIKKWDRLKILRETIEFQAEQLQNVKIINIVADKQNKPSDADIFEIA